MLFRSNPHRIVISRSSSVDANQSNSVPVTSAATNTNDFVLDLNRLQPNTGHTHAHGHEFLHQGLQINPESLQEFGPDDSDNHEHSHDRRVPPLSNLLSNSIIFFVIVLFKLLSDHILGKRLNAFLCDKLKWTKRLIY